MKFRLTCSILLVSLFTPACVSTPEPESSQMNVQLKQALSNPLRTDAQKQRDPYRRPVETLEFFGIEPDMTVVEIWPGGGWYASILGPYLKDQGRYIAAGFSSQSTVDYYRRGNQKFAQFVKENQNSFGPSMQISEFEPPELIEIAPAGSADAVLTFRNVHNWMARGTAEQAFSAFYRALKPGGVLGVVEHRASNKDPQDPQAKSGYVRQDFVIDLAQKAGFKLAASSEINANPKDGRDHPRGVWTLPPTLALGEKDRDAYLDIGESDRMTLKFIKPEE